MAGQIVLSHEERFDGSGYPYRLKGEDIPLPARLFAVIDTLDAMTFDRPYRKGLPFDVAKDEIQKMAGSQFDPKAVGQGCRNPHCNRRKYDPHRHAQIDARKICLNFCKTGSYFNKATPPLAHSCRMDA
jgi:hypothetical protein